MSGLAAIDPNNPASSGGNSIDPTTGKPYTEDSTDSYTPVSSYEASMDPAYYMNAANAAASQSQKYYQQGQAASSVAAPTIYNPSGAQSRQDLSGVNQAFNQNNAQLANVANGGGPNMGAAVQAQGMNANIAQQMAAANGKGGYSLAGALAAQGTGAQANGQLSNQAAQARQSQISTAQGSLANSLNAQGNTLLNQNQIQAQAATSQAGLAEAQNAQNQQQALALYNQSLNEQGTYLGAVSGYDNQADTALNQGLKERAQQDNQGWNIVGDAFSGVPFASGLLSTVAKNDTNAAASPQANAQSASGV